MYSSRPWWKVWRTEEEVFSILPSAPKDTRQSLRHLANTNMACAWHVPLFAECSLVGTQHSRCLPSALIKALGKEEFCRVYILGMLLVIDCLLSA